MTKIIYLSLFFISFVAQSSEFSRVDVDISKLKENLNQIRALLDKHKEDKNDKFWVKLKIDNMVKIDQLVRKSIYQIPSDGAYSEEEKKYFDNLISEELSKVDNENTQYLKELLKIYEWFKISEFGELTDNQAWLIVQHADDELKFQKNILDVLSKLYKTKETKPQNYAYLFDRVAASWSAPAERKLQRYGTQGTCVESSLWQPIRLEEPEKIDERRAEVGLSSMKEYTDFMKQFCN